MSTATLNSAEIAAFGEMQMSSTTVMDVADVVGKPTLATPGRSLNIQRVAELVMCLCLLACLAPLGQLFLPQSSAAAHAIATIGHFAQPQWALTAGILIALTLQNPFTKTTRPASKWLLQASVVLIGFRMN